MQSRVRNLCRAAVVLAVVAAVVGMTAGKYATDDSLQGSVTITRETDVGSVSQNTVRPATLGGFSGLAELSRLAAKNRTQSDAYLGKMWLVFSLWRRGGFAGPGAWLSRAALLASPAYQRSMEAIR